MHAQPLIALRACATEAGFVASTEARANYARVWARDGVICGLAALLTGADDLRDTTRRTLDTLLSAAGPSGQLPSNVTPEGGRVSYGGKAGRVDATLWGLVGAGVYARLTGDDAHLDRWWPTLMAARAVARAWEFNDRGLIYVPRAGDWADEYPVGGYVLFDQLVRLWALRELAAGGRRLGRPEATPLAAEARRCAARITTDYWPEPGAALFDPETLDPAIDPDRRHFIAAFEPGGVLDRFDAFGNALAVLLAVGRAEQRDAVCAHGLALRRHGLVPAFDPVITPTDREWPALKGLAGYGFRNAPGHYHNGGLWPMVNGFWAMATGDPSLGQAIRAANTSAGHPFPEYLSAADGAPRGTRGQAWSAAGEVFATTPGAAQALFDQGEGRTTRATSA